MKKLTTQLLVLALAAVMATTAIAQTPGPRGGGPGAPGGQQGRQMMMNMQKINQEIFAQLKLTADQKKKIDALMAKNRNEMQEFRKKMQSSQDRTALRGEMRKMREDQRKALEAILTPAQRTQYQKLWREKMQEMRRNRPGGPGGPGAPRGGGA